MTRKINNPNITYTVTGFKAVGRKYKVSLVERGIFDPIPAILYVHQDDQPLFSTDSKKIELGIHRVITRQLHHEDYIWIFDSNTNPLKDDVGFLTIEMTALRIMNSDTHL